jgi:hypothetical protein
MLPSLARRVPLAESDPKRQLLVAKMAANDSSANWTVCFPDRDLFGIRNKFLIIELWDVKSVEGGKAQNLLQVLRVGPR